MAKIFFQTHGCTTNFSESEVMQGLLKNAGFEITEQAKDSDIIIISICTVKGNNTAIHEINEKASEFPNKKIIVAGCITKDIIPAIRQARDDISLINTHNIKSITEIVEEVLNCNVVEILAKEEKEVKLGLPRVRKNNIIGIVPILSGCVFNCSYCSVKWIKGHLFSYPKERILEEVKSHLNEGCKEIWITSQDNAGYDLEVSNKSTLPELLNSITSINKDFYLRIGMMNPKNVMYMLDELIESYKNKKIFKFLHLPVQSGNNEILKLMNRQYTVEDFKNIVSEFRKKIPDITLSTDMMVGFPTETEEQFSDSVALLKEIKPDVLNISRFAARPNTKAAKMKQVSGGEIKERSRIITEIFHSIAQMKNEKWLRWEGEVLIDEVGKDNTFIGRNYVYKPVIVSGNLKIGDLVKVRIGRATAFDLRGIISSAS